MNTKILKAVNKRFYINKVNGEPAIRTKNLSSPALTTTASTRLVTYLDKYKMEERSIVVNPALLGVRGEYSVMTFAYLYLYLKYTSNSFISILGITERSFNEVYSRWIYPKKKGKKDKELAKRELVSKYRDVL